MPHVKCIICKKEFYVKPSHQKLGYGKYCSRECQRQGQLKGKYVHCYVCKKRIWKTPKALKHSKSKKFFCSKSCQTRWRNQYFSGPKHPNWKGGKYKEYRNILIKNRVKPKCKICGINDKRLLVVHHKDRKRTNNSLDNLVWLCLNCHYLVHHHNKKVN